MATKTMRKIGEKSTGSTSDKITGLKDIREQIDKIEKLFQKLEDKDQLQCLEILGVGSKYYTCQHCNKVKKKSDFYSSTAPNCASQITDGCKQCAADIAMPTVHGEKQQPTKKTVDDACYFLDKPMLDSLWDASLLEAANQATGKVKSNVWTSYIKNAAMPQYYTYTYRQSDNYTGGMLSIENLAEDALPKDQEILEQFEKNKNDVLRLLGYLPFEKEKLADQPFLYSQLIGFLDSDENGNDDMMRTSSIISIVRGFLQINQIDDMVADLVQDPRNAEKNIATVKALQEMKKNITMNVTKLAEQSCISLKNSKNSIKGENTWTGKLKKIKDLNLRGSEVNGFDIDTCRGMRQVQEISDASIMKQLALDESEWSDMVAEMRVMNQELRQERDQYKEINRILLRENLDLKDYLEENKLDSNMEYINLQEVYSVFGDMEEEDADEQDTSSK
ncbi:hypothetical protein SAMN05660484_02235 [Eubacterium ruminantium]|uniref:Uncharacterized protein n=1 Tax=Eubacterium ruminantium TaxID=42322 RepID=A0A1T4Q4L3_9FIRM|nr:hypothetical protein [Eubacterium ruminantium]SCW64277.1 hypothetical protein SAMN05660484_02235 [Eubacterium ruminantium]SDN30394.1 hypothetical protein SAMN04490370_11635 [Eubacterium ruminantium]SJZ98477.1 hypothetical protein SAMN02745110_02248 [Eubacterium ruminantium]